MKKIIILLIVFLLIGCSNTGNSSKEPVIPEDNSLYDAVTIAELSDHINGKDDYQGIQNAVKIYEQFSTNLLRQLIEKNQNEIISPFSLFKALGLLSNIANNDTRKEIETVLGLTVNDLNNYLYEYETNWGSQYQSVNGLWVDSDKGLTLKPELIETINEYYGEDTIKEFSFSDSSIVETVNSWASEKTNGAFEKVVDEGDIDNSCPLLILNALATGDKWDIPFDRSNTYPQAFNCYDGTIKNVDMMHLEMLGYWHLDNANGFAKRLQNGTDVIAILPNEGIDIYDFINTMPADAFMKMHDSIVDYDNYKSSGQWGCTWEEHISKISFPKFNYEKDYDLSTALKKLGLKNIFDYTQSDFSNLAQGNQEIIDQLYIQKVKQKAMIEVNEEEVKAAAITVMPGGLGGDGCKIVQTHYHDVIFDRPFIYAIYSYSKGPLFIGVVTDLGQEVTGALGQLENIAGKINIRNNPSTKGDVVGSIEKGQKSFYYETKEAEGYTWYRIGDNKWIADKNGEWLKKIG